MTYILLAYEFFKIGLFSFGGGFATIPFLYDISTKYGWYTIRELTNMTAVASMTPGPIGINAATYAGLKTAGIWGALIATISEVLPSLILVILLSKLLKRFSDNFYVKSIIETLKPIGCALLLSVAIGIIQPEMNDIKAIILLVAMLVLSWKNKKEPLFYMLIGGIVGIINAFIQTT
jgi:chromate transporter